MRAVAAASWASAWPMSRRRSSSADGTPGCTTGGPGGLGRPAEAAPEVDLEGEIEAGHRTELILRLEQDSLALDVLIDGTTRRVELGELEGPRDGDLRSRVHDSGGRDA